MTQESRFKPNQFKKLVWVAMKELGMAHADELHVDGLDFVYTRRIIRQSSNGFFRSEETWLVTFTDGRIPFQENRAGKFIQAVVDSGVRFVFAVICSTVAPETAKSIRNALTTKGIFFVLLTDELAIHYLQDVGRSAGPLWLQPGSNEDLKMRDSPSAIGREFSWRRLRKLAASVDLSTPWRKHFQMAMTQPGRLRPLQNGSSTLIETDLLGIVTRGSFVLHGEPGTGKTAMLEDLAWNLALAGPLMPVRLDITEYQHERDLVIILANRLDLNTKTDEARRKAAALTNSLLQSGSLVVLLDGLDESVDADRDKAIVDSLNQLTDPSNPCSRTTWVVAGRGNDADKPTRRLTHLKNRRWEVLPLSADLVHDYLIDQLGEVNGAEFYRQLGRSVEELCACPLLLNMTIEVYQQSGTSPSGRGRLYREYINHLLDKYYQKHKQKSPVDGNLPELRKRWTVTAVDAMVSLTHVKDRDWIPTVDALNEIASALDLSGDNAQALLEDLIGSGVLRRESEQPIQDVEPAACLESKVTFFHHTLREYLSALQLRNTNVEELIPEQGVDSDRFEAVVFLAGIRTDLASIVRRAVYCNHLVLAFEIAVDVIDTLPQELVHELGRKLWLETQCGGEIGERRLEAQCFGRLASHLIAMSDTRDTAAEHSRLRVIAANVWTRITDSLSVLHRTRVDGFQHKGRDPFSTAISKGVSMLFPHYSGGERTARLLHFYGQLGNKSAQEELLSDLDGSSEIPEYLLGPVADARFEVGRTADVIALYSRIANSQPELQSEEARRRKAAAFNNRGVAFWHSKKPEEAEKDFQSAINLSPTACFHCNYGLLLSECMDRRDEAIDQFAYALERDPGNAAAHHGVASILLDDSPYDALTHLVLAVELAPHNGDRLGYLEQLAALQENLRQRAEAVKSLQQLVRIAPTSSKLQDWKKKIDALTWTRTGDEVCIDPVRSELRELAIEFAEKAGCEIEFSHETPRTFTTGDEHVLRVLLVDDADVSVTSVNQLIASLEQTNSPLHYLGSVLIITSAVQIAPEVRDLAVSVARRVSLHFLLASEVQDTVLNRPMDCKRLLDRVLQDHDRRHASDPFKYDGLVKDSWQFFGRNDILSRLRDMLVTGKQVSICGLHKIGKSSLLEQLRRRIQYEHPEFSVIKIVLDGQDSGAWDFYDRVLRALPGALPLPNQSELTAYKFCERLFTFHERRQKQYGNHKLILMIDEIQFLLPSHSGERKLEFFEEILGLIRELLEQSWFMFLPCGRTAALNRQAMFDEFPNPLVNMVEPTFLSPFTREENDHLMNTLGAYAQLSFTEGALEEIYKWTAGHPKFSRSLGSQLLIDLNGAVGEVTEDMIWTAKSSFLKNRDRLSLLRLEYEKRLTNEERRIVTTLAIDGPQAQSAFFPEKCGFEQKIQIRDAIENLIDTTILDKTDDGLLQHRYGLLREMIRDHESDFCP